MTTGRPNGLPVRHLRSGSADVRTAPPGRKICDPVPGAPFELMADGWITMIQLVDVYKSFGPKRVLDGFTLDVVEGETMVIIGYSGTGKTVAIKHIVGLLEPDRGTVEVDGFDVPHLSRRDLYQLRARI